MNRSLILATWLSWACGSGAIAGEFELSGRVASELRSFVNDPAFDGQLEHFQPSATFEPDFAWQSDSGYQQINISPFVRADSRDSARTHVDLREAHWLYLGDDVELLVGIDQVFWGVTESRHLVNIINQIDQVEDIDEEDYLGEPMLNLASQRNYGRFEIFVLPGFRERQFPGRNGRLRTGLVVDEDQAEFESDLGRWSTDVAFRYAHFLGDWDIGLSYFYGTSREARLALDEDGASLIPLYDQIHQIGLDLQYTRDAALWKLEAIGREGQGTFGAFVGGLEYTFFQALDSDIDVGALVELLYDARDPGKAPPTAFDNDIFVGTRIALNDVQDSSALFGTIIDLESGASSVRLEMERRIGDDYKLELESQWFIDVQDDPVLADLRDDAFITVRLSRFF